MRSGFIRQAVAARPTAMRLKGFEKEEVAAYRKLPMQKDEFDLDPRTQAWPEDWEDDSIWEKWEKWSAK